MLPLEGLEGKTAEVQYPCPACAIHPGRNSAMTAQIEPLSDTSSIEGLVALLRDAVSNGASIGFLDDLTWDEAAEYWRKVIADMEAGSRLIWVARVATSGPIVGSVQLGLERRRNGRHRAEVQKLMVLKAHRRQGIAARLMREVERTAAEKQISLLFLDTSEGSGGARKFYEATGYTYAGGIPGYALDPNGLPAKNAIFYKQL
jgi:acetyltransferase